MNYVNNFSYEWIVHHSTQLDSVTGTNESMQSFINKTGIYPVYLLDKLVLDAGCGVGRYTEVMAKHGADVIAMDMSDSVISAYNNMKDRPNVHVVRGDINKPPFKYEIFDYIVSIGVLHHTPNTENAFISLTRYLKKKGIMAIWVYPDEPLSVKLYNIVSGMYRLITTRLPLKLLYKLCYVAVPLHYVHKIPIIGKVVSSLLPVSGHDNSKWRVLDTYDWYSPKYQHKHTNNEVVGWYLGNGFKKIAILDIPVSVKGVKA